MPSKATASPTSCLRKRRTISKPCSAQVYRTPLSKTARARSHFLPKPALRRARNLRFLQDSCRLGGFPNLSRLVWYNCVGSKYDLTQRAAASAAASYLEYGGLLALSFEGVLLFRQFRPRQARHP